MQEHGCGAPTVSLSIAWTQSSGAPLFAAPALLPATGDLVMADVQGSITCLSAAAGAPQPVCIHRSLNRCLYSVCQSGYNSLPGRPDSDVRYAKRGCMQPCWRVTRAGEMLWKCPLGAAVYSPPCVLGQVDTGMQVLLGSQNGRLHSLDGATGRLLWVQPAAHGDGASAGARMSLTAWSEVGSSAMFAAQRTGVRSSRAASCVSDGTVAVIGVEDTRESRVLAACRLESEVFSAPAAFGPFIVCGCRDDHLYCLRVTKGDFLDDGRQYMRIPGL